jgi:hypothetical protein
LPSTHGSDPAKQKLNVPIAKSTITPDAKPIGQTAVCAAAETNLVMTIICPHCGHNRIIDILVAGAAKGAIVRGMTIFFAPELGAAALSGLALVAWRNSGKTEIQCHKCKKYYHT